VSADAVYFGLGNGKFDHDADSPAGSVWKIDLGSGKKLWEFPLNNAVLGTPVVDKDLVIFGSRDQHCYAVDQSSGKSRWKFDLGAPVVASPIVAGGKVYALTVTGSLACIDEITGNLEWRFDELSAPDEDAYSSPTLADGRLYVAVAGKLYCVGDAEK
jgi:outer membrane protein assembly factor BamB